MDGNICLTEEEIHRFMREALRQAENALNDSEVPVGCIFINRGKEIIATGYNKTNETLNGTQHAELVAIQDAVVNRGQDPSIFKDSILFVSCEPCIMCAAAIAKVEISAVYFGCHNDRFGGNGSILSIHQDPETDGMDVYQVHSGILKEEAIAVFQRFYESENRRAPENKRRRKG
jgi:tRNA-specific adenosine deaminase 2